MSATRTAGHRSAKILGNLMGGKNADIDVVLVNYEKFMDILRQIRLILSSMIDDAKPVGNFLRYENGDYLGDVVSIQNFVGDVLKCENAYRLELDDGNFYKATDLEHIGKDPESSLEQKLRAHTAKKYKTANVLDKWPVLKKLKLVTVVVDSVKQISSLLDGWAALVSLPSERKAECLRDLNSAFISEAAGDRVEIFTFVNTLNFKLLVDEEYVRDQLDKMADFFGEPKTYNAESIRKQIVGYIRMFYMSAKELVQVLLSPDVDKKTMAQGLMKTLEMYTGSDRSLAYTVGYMKKHINTLESNFDDYYKDCAITGNMSSMLIRFMSDVGKEHGKADAKLIAGIRKITSKVVTTEKQNNPERANDGQYNDLVGSLMAALDSGEKEIEEELVGVDGVNTANTGNTHDGVNTANSELGNQVGNTQPAPATGSE